MLRRLFLGPFFAPGRRLFRLHFIFSLILLGFHAGFCSGQILDESPGRGPDPGQWQARYTSPWRAPGPLKEEPEEVFLPRNFRLSFGIGGNVPLRDVGDTYNTGTIMELLFGYSPVKFLLLEGGIGYTTGFLNNEGFLGYDFGSGTIIELRGSYISLPLGLRLTKSLWNENVSASLGGGVLYNRYAQSLNFVDYLGLRAQETESRDGVGYYGLASYDHFFGSQYGLAAKVRYVRTHTSGENVGGVLTEEEDYDPEVTGDSSDGWLAVTVSLIYRF